MGALILPSKTKHSKLSLLAAKQVNYRHYFRHTPVYKGRNAGMGGWTLTQVQRNGVQHYEYKRMGWGVGGGGVRPKIGFHCEHHCTKSKSSRQLAG